MLSRISSDEQESPTSILASSESAQVWVLVSEFDLLLGDLRKNTFSGVGLGHDNMPFLSTQHNA